MQTRHAVRAVVIVGMVLALAGCQFDGIGSLPLPFRAGDGDGSYDISVRMDNVANLAPNAEVKVGDITVGSVKSLAFDNWKAKVVVGLDAGTVLPENATAQVAQKSLLGAEYLDLAPPTREAPVGQMRDGDTIPIEHTGRFPETEEVLAALSVVLNGGGLQQIRTITTELNHVLDGHQQDIRSLIGNLGQFVGTLNAQKGDIIRAIDGLNRLSGTLAQQTGTIQHALDTIPPGLAVLSRDRDQLVGALVAVGNLGAVATRVINDNTNDLVANLRNLQPVLKNLADAGANLTGAVSEAVTYPFPSKTSFPSVVKGDYGNLYATFDITPGTLYENLLAGFRIGPGVGLPAVFGPLAAGVPATAAVPGLPALPHIGGGR